MLLSLILAASSLASLELPPWRPGGPPDGVELPPGTTVNYLQVEPGECYTSTHPKKGQSVNTTRIVITCVEVLDCCSALFKVTLAGSHLNDFDINVHSVSINWGPPITVDDHGPIVQEMDANGGQTLYFVLSAECGKTYQLQVAGPFGELCVAHIYCGQTDCQEEIGQ